jgi:hypothetical protein
MFIKRRIYINILEQKIHYIPLIDDEYSDMFVPH